MYDIERQNMILEILKEKKTISVNALSKMVYASGATVRRDLSKMEQKGLVHRTFGAVTFNANPTNNETAFQFRESTNIIEKRALCSKAIEFIKDNTVIFIDSSSTVVNLCPLLNNFSHLTIITNGLNAANEIIAKTKHKVIIAGGEISPATNSVAGPITRTLLNKLHCDTAIMSCASFSFKENELCENTIEQSETKSIMTQRSSKVIIIADKTKANKEGMFVTGGLENIDILISNYVLTEEDKTLISKFKFEYIYVK